MSVAPNSIVIIATSVKHRVMVICPSVVCWLPPTRAIDPPAARCDSAPKLLSAHGCSAGDRELIARNAVDRRGVGSSTGREEPIANRSRRAIAIAVRRDRERDAAGIHLTTIGSRREPGDPHDKGAVGPLVEEHGRVLRATTGGRSRRGGARRRGGRRRRGCCGWWWWQLALNHVVVARSTLTEVVPATAAVNGVVAVVAVQLIVVLVPQDDVTPTAAGDGVAAPASADVIIPVPTIDLIGPVRADDQVRSGRSIGG